jgi:hypothetical protein
LKTLRVASPKEASDRAIDLLNHGCSPQSLFEAFFDAAGELMMRSPGILSLHATTFTNALYYAWNRCHDEQTRKLLLLQNASFLPLFRGNTRDAGTEIDALEPAESSTNGPSAIEEIFAEIKNDRLSASRKMLAYLQQVEDPGPFAQAARRLIFQKGTNSHDYKYSSAILEDYHSMRRPWRDRYLAASAFYLKSSGDPDNQLVQRIRSALSA